MQLTNICLRHFYVYRLIIYYYFLYFIFVCVFFQTHEDAAANNIPIPDATDKVTEVTVEDSNPKNQTELNEKMVESQTLSTEVENIGKVESETSKCVPETILVDTTNLSTTPVLTSQVNETNVVEPEMLVEPATVVAELCSTEVKLTAEIVDNSSVEVVTVEDVSHTITKHEIQSRSDVQQETTLAVTASAVDLGDNNPPPLPSNPPPPQASLFAESTMSPISQSSNGEEQVVVQDDSLNTLKSEDELVPDVIEENTIDPQNVITHEIEDATTKPLSDSSEVNNIQQHIIVNDCIETAISVDTEKQNINELDLQLEDRLAEPEATSVELVTDEVSHPNNEANIEITENISVIQSTVNTLSQSSENLHQSDVVASSDSSDTSTENNIASVNTADVHAELDESHKIEVAEIDDNTQLLSPTEFDEDIEAVSDDFNISKTILITQNGHINEEESNEKVI